MERGEIASEEQFFLLSTIFCYLMLDFYAKTRARFSLRDKRLLEITEVEITRVACILSEHFSYFLYISTPFISNYWYPKVNFLEQELFLRYQMI